MKNFKKITLGLLGAAILSLGLYACSNDETTNSKQENSEQNNTLQSKSETNVLIARQVSESSAILLFDSKQLKLDLVEEGLFAEVESIEVGENLLTIIGKDVKDYSLSAFQTELIKDGNELYFPNPNDPDLPVTTFAKHTCAGNGCSSCDFTRKGGSLSKITGCACNGDGTCNHTKSGQDVADTVKDVVEIAVKVVGLFK